MKSGPDALADQDSASTPNDTQSVGRMAHVSTKRDCDLTRAIDGYVVCVPEAKTTPLVAAPTRNGHAFNVSLDAARTAQSVQFEPMRNQPGQYLVIGSFNGRDNALRWAEFNAEFGTGIYVATDAARQWYRVVVGPLDEADSPAILREIFAAVGLTESWYMAICGDPAGPGDCPDLDSAHCDAGRRDLGAAPTALTIAHGQTAEGVLNRSSNPTSNVSCSPTVPRVGPYPESWDSLALKRASVRFGGVSRVSSRVR